MANRYWVGGSATWDGTAGTKWATTSGGAGGAAVPTAADDVFFDAVSSGTVITTNAVSVGRSVNCTGFTGTLQLNNNTASLTIGDGTAGASNVALTLSSGMTLTIGGANSTIIFASTSATQQTITTNGKTMPTVSFNGSGGSWINSDNMTSSGTISMINGTWDTGNFAIQAATFGRTSAGTFTLTPGSSTITATSASTAINNNTPSNFTVSSNTATFTASGGGNLTMSTTNYNGMSIVVTVPAGTTVVTGTPTNLKDITLNGAANKTGGVSFGSSITFSGAFTATGNSATNRIFVYSSTTGTTITLSAATASLSNVDFADITGAGAASWTGTSLGDVGNNSNITFTSPVTRYAVTAGNFSSTGMWSTSSGGSSGASVPLPQDTVYFDASSGAGTYTDDMPRIGRTVDFTGFTRTLASSAAWGWCGSVTLSSGMTITANNTLTFYGRGSHTLTSAGKSWTTSANPGFDHGTGTYTFQDAFTTGGTIGQTSGAINTNGYTVTMSAYGSSGTNATRSLTLGTSTISLTGTGAGNIWNIAGATSFTLSALSSTITIANTSANNRSITGGGLAYGTFNYTLAGSTGSLTSAGANYFDTLNFSDATNARTLIINGAATTTVRNFNVQGTSGKLMSVVSNVGGTPALLELVGPVSTVDYLSVQDITSTLPYKFYAGANSTSVSGNSQVIFTAPVTQPYISRQFQTVAGTSTSTSTLFPFGASATAGNLLIVAIDFYTNPGTVTAPSGYTLIDTAQGTSNAYTQWWYKVATGGETGASISWVNNVANIPYMFELGGFTGTPTLDVKDKNNSAGSTVTSITTGSGVSNTASPAYVMAIFGGSNTLGATTSISGSYQEARQLSATVALKALGLPLSSTGSQQATYGWTTSRVASSQLAVFYGVASATAQYRMLTGMGV